MTSSSTGRMRVLHVNDELDFADLTATFLERESDRFDVGTATSADEGLEILANRGLDCIVSDYDMPGMNGIEFLEAVRGQHPELPFILYTGKGSEEVAGEAISAGVTDYIQKESGTDQYLLLANRIENAVTNYWTQQTAKQRKERFEMFFEESPIGAVQWDENFRFERVNERAEEILGYTEAELRGESWQTVVAESDRKRVGDTARRLLSTGDGRYVVSKNVRKDGEIRQCEWHNRVVTDGDGEASLLFSNFQDITDREWRKTELDKYETIVETLSDAVYVLDEEGRFTYVNDEFVELVGYDRETIIGNTASLIKDDEAIERAERQLSRLLSRDGPETVRFEVTVHPRLGDPVVCQDHMSVLPYEGEQFDGSVGVLRAVTERTAREREREAAER
jgi:PAS domain S-box-containing protein